VTQILVNELDCETIHREKNEWVLKKNEFNAKEEFEKALNSIQNKDSFLHSIISFLNIHLEQPSRYDLK
jgi:hypothetical protein